MKVEFEALHIQIMKLYVKQCIVSRRRGTQFETKSKNLSTVFDKMFITPYLLYQIKRRI